MASHEYDIIVIGAGSAGLYCCARLAFLSSGYSICLLDSNNRVGKKLMLTGSGRCNLTNLNIGSEFYTTDAPDKLELILNTHSSNDVIDFFENSLGVLTDIKDNLVYPATYKSGTVVDALRFYLSDNSINIFGEKTVINIKKSDKYIVTTSDKDTYVSKYLVMATGGVSYPNTGSNGSGFSIAATLIDNKDIEPLKPALVPLISSDKDIKQLSGTKVYSSITLNDVKNTSESGELLFTDNGISGIMVFAISGIVSKMLKERQKVQVSINLVKKNKSEVIELINYRIKQFGHRNIIDGLSGIVRSNIIEVILKRLNINFRTVLYELNESDIDNISEMLTAFKINIVGTGDIKDGQVTSGGIKLNKLSSCMEYASNLFFIGEMVNVDGICGGYNLQWAMSSADACAREIVSRIENN